MSDDIRLFFAASLAFYTCTSPAQTELPKSCTSADNSLLQQQERVAHQELARGNTGGFVNAMRLAEASLSPACRNEVIREQPMRTRCSTAERALVLKGSQIMVSAALAGNLDPMFATFFKLEELISEDCWVAANRSAHPLIRGACSTGEMDHIAAHASPMTKATLKVLAQGDILTLLGVLQNVQSRLSPPCAAAVQRVMAQGSSGSSAGPSRSTPLPGVQDHGGGTLSIPGVGACTPTGCMAF